MKNTFLLITLFGINLYIMKTLLKILIPLLLLSQSCKAQDLQKYVKQYEDIVPKL